MAVSPPSQQPISSQSQADYDFGQAIRFSLQVQAGEPVTAVTLFFRSADRPVTNTAGVAIQPGLEVLASHTVDLTQFRLAPFTTVTYWWRVIDASGNVIDIPEQSFAYEDDRFKWQQVTAENTIIRYIGDDPAIGQLALDIFNEALPRLEAVQPVALPEPLRIYIYPSAADLQASLRLTGRNWVGGHTNPELSVILVTAANARTAATGLRQSLPHELTHLALFQATGTAYETLPAWFNEGLAATMEANPDPNGQVLLQEAVTNGTTLSFSDLCVEFPADGRQALLAYAQSASLIEYIQSEYGNRRINEMIVTLADGADCQSVVSRALNTSLQQLDEDWRQSLDQQSSPLDFIENSLIWLLLLGSGFLLMLFFVWPVRREG